jgi:hypothetical protein
LQHLAGLEQRRVDHVDADGSRLALDTTQEDRSQNCEGPDAPGGGAAELIQAFEGPEAGVLGQVLRLGGVSGQSQRDPVEIVEMHEDVRLESADAVAGRGLR